MDNGVSEMGLVSYQISLSIFTLVKPNLISHFYFNDNKRSIQNLIMKDALQL